MFNPVRCAVLAHSRLALAFLVVNLANCAMQERIRQALALSHLCSALFVTQENTKAAQVQRLLWTVKPANLVHTNLALAYSNHQIAYFVLLDHIRRALESQTPMSVRCAVQGRIRLGLESTIHLPVRSVMLARISPVSVVLRLQTVNCVIQALTETQMQATALFVRPVHSKLVQEGLLLPIAHYVLQAHTRQVMVLLPPQIAAFVLSAPSKQAKA
mmetsp:Transcript_28683/g.60009  ORF Transcript_28683/g.60009 Transcript_28683/m.60009 type:complete len:215 (+) Transcript_28683:4582-5226(+)